MPDASRTVTGRIAKSGVLMARAKGLILAVLSASIAGILSLFAIGVIQLWLDGHPVRVFENWTLFDLRLIGSLGAFFAAIALASMLLIAVPLTWIFSKARVESGWIYPLAGFVTGAIVGVLAFTPTHESIYGFTWLDLLKPGLIGGTSGFFAGSAWWISYRKRQVEQRFDTPPMEGMP